MLRILVDQVENPCVGGSIPPRATKKTRSCTPCRSFQFSHCQQTVNGFMLSVCFLRLVALRFATTVVKKEQAMSMSVRIDDSMSASFVIQPDSECPVHISLPLLCNRCQIKSRCTELRVNLQRIPKALFRSLNISAKVQYTPVLN